MDTTQVIFNIVVGIAGTVCTFVLYAIWSKLSELEKSDKDLTHEISAMRVLIAGDYIKRSEIAPQLQDIFDELKGLRHELSKKIERRSGE